MEILKSMTAIQIKKASYLAEKGGEAIAIDIHIVMPDKSTATVDPFGRVTWQNKDEDSVTNSTSNQLN